MSLIKLPQLSWYEPRELVLPLPDSWQVEVCNMAGYNRPALNDNQIKAAITHPIGTPRIRDLARGKNEVVIIFDDIHRVTKVARITPFVLEELAEAGISDSRIRFIGATGTHAPMDRSDFAKKLGEAVLARFPVYNHNPYDNCTYIGTTSRGTKVSVNTEVLNCDFRIVIGSVMPHLFVVFGGGSKIILPGVSSFETIAHNHMLKYTPEEKTNYETNTIHLDMDEAAAMVSVDVNIEGLVNLWGDTVALWTGDLKQSHDIAIQEAKSHYLTKRAKDKDIVIANTYAKVTESATGFGASFPSVKQEGGDIALICNAPSGQVVHYLSGLWGKYTSVVNPVRIPVPPHINHLIVYTEYPDLTGLGYFEQSNRVTMLSNWDDVLRVLQEAHGDSATVAVYPNADIPYFG